MVNMKKEWKLKVALKCCSGNNFISDQDPINII